MDHKLNKLNLRTPSLAVSGAQMVSKGASLKWKSGEAGSTGDPLTTFSTVLSLRSLLMVCIYLTMYLFNLFYVVL